jgi:hypothetical protein
VLCEQLDELRREFEPFNPHTGGRSAHDVTLDVRNGSVEAWQARAQGDQRNRVRRQVRLYKPTADANLDQSPN